MIGLLNPFPLGSGGGGGAGGGAGSHRYWRLELDNGLGGSRYVVGRVGLFTEIGGTDLAQGAAVSASSNFSGYVPGNAVDGNDDSFWVTNQGFQSLDIDLGAGGEQEILYLLIQGSDKSGSENAGTVRLRYSDDGVSWTTYLEANSVPWAYEGHMFYFDGDGVFGVAGQIWRLHITAINGASRADIREIQLRSTVGGSDITSPSHSQPFCDQHFSGYLGYNAFDNANSIWASNSTSGIIGYNLRPENAAAIAQVLITVGNASEAPKDFTIEKSDDGGLTFTTVKTLAGETGWSAGVARAYNL